MIAHSTYLTKLKKKALERAHKKKETKENQSGRDNTLEGKN
jgi:hypothetical protein